VLTRRPGSVEIESLEEFDALVGGGSTSMNGWRIQSLDLRGRTTVLLTLDPAGAMLLGCSLSERAERHLQAHGALVFPAVPDVPFNPYRGDLYNPAELYDGLRDSSYEQTLDARIYAWSRQTDHDLAGTLARSLHDFSIDDALAEATPDRPVVGVMGGHTVGRDTASYAQAAQLGRSLTRAGYHVATGGGPGAMEAANLGAYLSDQDDAAVRDAIGPLTAVPSFRPSVTDWARTAFDVRGRWPEGRPSLGVPTWFYGHEPPNIFASSIAKYFQNALREDVLLSLCTGGIVFLPGAAGTVREIFEDACENYYATGQTVAPMVLVGVGHWDGAVPAWPLLHALAEGRGMQSKVFLVDTVDEAIAALSS
jgi:predicted Rossmann-fold nucleotide-binding protein